MVVVTSDKFETPVPPSTQQGVSPGVRSLPAETFGGRPVISPRGLSTAGGKLPRLSAFPKPEEGYTLGVRPQTSPVVSDTSAASFIARLNAPSSRLSPRSRGSPRLGRMSPAGKVIPDEVEAQAMIIKQREAFAALHAKCAALEKANGIMSNKISVLERETISLRVRAMQLSSRTPSAFACPCDAPVLWLMLLIACASDCHVAARRATSAVRRRPT